MHAEVSFMVFVAYLLLMNILCPDLRALCQYLLRLQTPCGISRHIVKGGRGEPARRKCPVAQLSRPPEP